MACVEDVRRRLAEEREQTQARLASLTGDHDAIVAASLDTNADDEHDPEGATIAFERSQIGALVRQVRGHLAEVDAALAPRGRRDVRRVRALRVRHRRGAAGGAAGRAAVHRVRVDSGVNGRT